MECDSKYGNVMNDILIGSSQIITHMAQKQSRDCKMCTHTNISYTHRHLQRDTFFHLYKFHLFYDWCTVENVWSRVKEEYVHIIKFF